MYVELAREVLSFAMLCIASYFDLRLRKVNDLVWIIFGGSGAALYMLAPSGPVPVLYIISGAALALAGMRVRIFGAADCLGIASLSVVIPSYNGIPLAVAVSLASPVLASLHAASLNVAFNLPGLIRHTLFEGVSEAGYRKALAFFMLHRKRKWERFVFPAQKDGRFVLCPAAGQGFAENFQGFVMSARPLVPFMLLAEVVIFLALRQP